MLALALAALGLSAQARDVTKPGAAGIASANALATEAGFETLARGGNAVDAAVAVATSLSVVQPEASGMGGGFLALIHDAATGKNIFVDARERAPKAVRESDYLKADGTPNRDTSLNGPLAAGIPGFPAGLAHISSKYGKLPLAESLRPAIKLGEEGFRPTAALASSIERKAEVLRRYPASVRKFMPGGKPPQTDGIFRDPDQARTLRTMAERGADGFYKGEVAQEMVRAVKAAGGTWTLEDLAAYQAKERAPIELAFDGHTVITAPPPSSGGVAIAEMLNILAPIDLERLCETERTHYLIEAMRRAFRDHNQYLGDPDFVDMPLDMLLSRHYADGLRQSILRDRATKSEWLPAAHAPEPGMHTTHFSIIDKDGNMVSMTATVNTSLGSGFVAGTSGILLNNEMDDFALVSGQPNAFGLIGGSANAPVGGKRMLSSMSPSFVIGKDRLAVIGSPGGSTIITQVLVGILAFIEGKSAGEITAQKRIHHQYLPDRVDYEPGSLSEEAIAKLRAMGHTLNERRPWGNMNVVTWDKVAHRLSAASDPRSSAGMGKVEAVK
ncbi:gamma-glutamyltranspeptidase/glutathione hydrolase [Luteimonas cucumeris]|uniref:Glutathione hydrolase proenzyme n=2 Tax=Luteimonas cucumeris TaxID=985012 RepID=A0A562L243_9GAMM|nr:gamma-glutamyltransferase [Luteimonas cucumeris]TWI01703.1 gamma-glutamyltranspeptidase/glutathione hydrolase [Luteimonas cucumeris]